jgi:hypothetical protein
LKDALAQIEAPLIEPYLEDDSSIDIAKAKARAIALSLELEMEL